MSEEKIVGIHGAVAVEGQPDAELVAEIRLLLERAERGEINGIAYATCTVKGEIGSGWNGGQFTRWPLGSAVSILQHRYMQRLLENN